MSQPQLEDAVGMGKRIADLREERGWTQKQLAERAGLSITFLSEVENGKRNISYGKLLRIADELGTSMDYLARGVQSDPRPRPPVEFPSALSDAAEEKGCRGHREDRAGGPRLGGLVRNLLYPQGPKAGKEHAKTDGKSGVPHAGHHKSLRSGPAVCRIAIPKPDEEIRAETYPLPPEVEDEEVVGQE